MGRKVAVALSLQFVRLIALFAVSSRENFVY